MERGVEVQARADCSSSLYLLLHPDLYLDRRKKLEVIAKETVSTFLPELGSRINLRTFILRNW